MDRANLAAKKLVQEGYTTVRVLSGGYPEWQKVKPITEREKPKRG
jgi:rhodanese-related sulfurtransferase